MKHPHSLSCAQRIHQEKGLRQVATERQDSGGVPLRALKLASKRCIPPAGVCRVASPEPLCVTEVPIGVQNHVQLYSTSSARGRQGLLGSGPRFQRGDPHRRPRQRLPLSHPPQRDRSVKANLPDASHPPVPGHPRTILDNTRRVERMQHYAKGGLCGRNPAPRQAVGAPE